MARGMDYNIKSTCGQFNVRETFFTCHGVTSALCRAVRWSEAQAGDEGGLWLGSRRWESALRGASGEDARAESSQSRRSTEGCLSGASQRGSLLRNEGGRLRGEAGGEGCWEEVEEEGVWGEEEGGGREETEGMQRGLRREGSCGGLREWSRLKALSLLSHSLSATHPIPSTLLPNPAPAARATGCARH